MEYIPGAIGIQHFRNGKCVSQDVYADRQKMANFCVAFSPETAYCSELPEKTTEVEIRCPGSLGGGQCGNKVQKWSCPKCKEILKFGFDDKFYCNCGSAQTRTYEFKCNDGNHGLQFLRFENEDVLAKLVEKLVVFGEKNILILGEAGAGKSTWINAMVNYLQYATFDEAIKNEFHCPIPFSYTVRDEDGKEVTYETGTDKNELIGTTEAGKSATQHPKSHVLKRGDKLYRLIDTPGFSNFQDKEEKYLRIMEYISDFAELHAILILIHPDSPNFSFYVKWLFARLHKNCKPNICFCFTHGRKHGYLPGDAYATLSKILEDANFEPIHCVNFVLDNESIRFLAQLKLNSDYQALDEEYSNSNRSWTQSAEETNKFFDHIMQLNPCNTKDIVEHHFSLCQLNVTAKMVLETGKKANELVALKKKLETQLDETKATYKQQVEDPNTRLKMSEVKQEAEALEKEILEVNATAMDIAIRVFKDAENIQQLVERVAIDAIALFDDYPEEYVETLTAVAAEFVALRVNTEATYEFPEVKRIHLPEPQQRPAKPARRRWWRFLMPTKKK